MSKEEKKELKMIFKIKKERKDRRKESKDFSRPANAMPKRSAEGSVKAASQARRANCLRKILLQQEKATRA